MDEVIQQTLAIWAVLVVPFVGLAAFLYARNELTPYVVAVYWSPAVVLTAIGSIPPPWQPLTG